MSRAISPLRGASGVLEILEDEIFVVTIKYDEDQKRVLEVPTFRDGAASFNGKLSLTERTRTASVAKGTASRQ
jgi:hypothetical protein